MEPNVAVLERQPPTSNTQLPRNSSQPRGKHHLGWDYDNLYGEEQRDSAWTCVGRRCPPDDFGARRGRVQRRQAARADDADPAAGGEPAAADRADRRHARDQQAARHAAPDADRPQRHLRSGRHAHLRVPDLRQRGVHDGRKPGGPRLPRGRQQDRRPRGQRHDQLHARRGSPADHQALLAGPDDPGHDHLGVVGGRQLPDEADGLQPRRRALRSADPRRDGRRDGRRRDVRPRQGRPAERGDQPHPVPAAGDDQQRRVLDGRRGPARQRPGRQGQGLRHAGRPGRLHHQRLPRRHPVPRHRRRSRPTPSSGA